MAGAALHAAKRNMGRRCHARRHHIVMAIGAVGIRRLMRKHRAQERGGAGVAGLARQVGRQVITWFSEGIDVVMTSGTAVRDAGMVHDRGRAETHGGLVTHVARCDRRDMV